MLFEHHQESFKSSKLIEGHPQLKRVSRRESRINEFKIPNPLSNTHPYNQSYVPNLPTSIKNELSGVDYLTYSHVNNIGKGNTQGPFVVNKRNSRFSKRLMAMQKALQMQGLKLHSMETGTMQQHVFNHEYVEKDEAYMSLMDEERNSLEMECMMGENLEQEVDMDFCLEMCQQESQVTEIEYYSQNDIRPEINYNEYESYLNV